MATIRALKKRLVRLGKLRRKMERASNTIEAEVVNADKADLLLLNRASIALIDRVRERLAADLKSRRSGRAPSAMSEEPTRWATLVLPY
jgi:hypothetical protein